MGYDRIITLRPDTASNWSSSNPILSRGEGAIETDTGYIKIGDGTSAYNSLGYLTPQVDTYDLTSSSYTHTLPKVLFKGQVCDVFWTNGGTYTLTLAVSDSETVGGTAASVWKGEGDGHIRVISDGSNWQVVEYEDVITVGATDSPNNHGIVKKTIDLMEQLIFHTFTPSSWNSAGAASTYYMTETIPLLHNFANTNYEAILVVNNIHMASHALIGQAISTKQVNQIDGIVQALTNNTSSTIGFQLFVVGAWK